MDLALNRPELRGHSLDAAVAALCSRRRQTTSLKQIDDEPMSCFPKGRTSGRE